MASKGKVFKPRLAIGQPFVPEKPPLKRGFKGAVGDINTPNSFTAYDDVTGQPLFKAGDRPDVPEMISVIPLTEGQKQAIRNDQSRGNANPALSDALYASENMQNRRRFPSLASGGYVVAGGSNPDDEERRRRDRERAMYNARRDPIGLGNYAYSSYLRNNQDARSSQYGVQGPVDVNIPLDAGFKGNAFSRAALRTPEQVLQDQFDTEDVNRPLELPSQQASLTRGRAGSIDSIGGADTSPYQTSGGGGGDNRAPGIKQRTVNASQYGQSGININDETAKLNGLEEYRNPFQPNAAPEYVTPAEKKIREARDDRMIEQELERRYPKQKRELQELSESELADVIAFPEDYPELMKDNPDMFKRAIYAEFAKRGFSPRAVEILVQRAKLKADSGTDESQYIAQKTTPPAKPKPNTGLKDFIMGLAGG